MARYMTHPSTLDRMACRLQYKWSRQYKTRTAAPALDFGIAIHHALEQYYSAKVDPVEAFREYMSENSVELTGLTASDTDLGVAMLTNYKTRYKYEKMTIIATELEMARRVPAPKDDPHPPTWAKDFYIGARIDAIVYDRALGESFVLEHKTFSTFYPQYLQLGHQFVIEKYIADGYMKKQKKYPQRIAGVIYNGLRKSSKPSKTTNLFERMTIYITDDQVHNMLHRVYWKLLEVNSKFYPIFPEPTAMTCQYCEFKQPCVEYQRGGDYQFLLDNAYTERVDEEDEWE